MTAPAAIQDDAPVRVGTGDTVEYQRASMREPLVGIVACQSPLTGLITLDDGTDLIPSRELYPLVFQPKQNPY